MSRRKTHLILSLLLIIYCSIVWSAPASTGKLVEDVKDQDGVGLDLLPLDDLINEPVGKLSGDPAIPGLATPEVFTIEDESEDLELFADGHYIGHANPTEQQIPLDNQNNQEDTKNSTKNEYIYDDDHDELILVNTSLLEQEKLKEKNVEKRFVRDVSGLEDDVDEGGNEDSKKLEHMSRVEKIKYRLQPVGPIAEKEKIMKNFYHRFNSNPRENVKWSEPVFLSNCWGQAMLSTRYSFAPSCHEDGSFGPKQCYLERCWCVNPDGSNQVKNPRIRFHYKLGGILLRCYQNRLP